MAEDTFMSCTIVTQTYSADILKMFGDMGSSTQGLPGLLVLERILQSTLRKPVVFERVSVTATSWGHVIRCYLKWAGKSKAAFPARVDCGRMAVPSLDGEFVWLLNIEPDLNTGGSPSNLSPPPPIS